MSAKRLHRVCAALPDAELTHPFGPDIDVYKVAGKVFAVLGGNVGGHRITLKCAPERAEILVGEHEGIAEGYHMNKRHWITVDPASVAAGLVEDLVDDSYFLVRPTPRR
nr:MmcQ/YjbR family DNA-binding protein [Rhodococcus sp. (in: high G+C Gram-positive bacteria)]